MAHMAHMGGLTAWVDFKIEPNDLAQYFDDLINHD
jgi:hypothetical protein